MTLSIGQKKTHSKEYS